MEKDSSTKQEEKKPIVVRTRSEPADPDDPYLMDRLEQ